MSQVLFVEVDKISKRDSGYEVFKEIIRLDEIRSARVWGIKSSEADDYKVAGIYDVTLLYMKEKGATIYISEAYTDFAERVHTVTL